MNLIESWSIVSLGQVHMNQVVLQISGGQLIQSIDAQ